MWVHIWKWKGLFLSCYHSSHKLLCSLEVFIMILIEVFQYLSHYFVWAMLNLQTVYVGLFLFTLSFKNFSWKWVYHSWYCSLQIDGWSGRSKLPFYLLDSRNTFNSLSSEYVSDTKLTRTYTTRQRIKKHCVYLLFTLIYELSYWIPGKTGI